MKLPLVDLTGFFLSQVLLGAVPGFRDLILVLLSIRALGRIFLKGTTGAIGGTAN
jgi:hypothetical protein